MTNQTVKAKIPERVKAEEIENIVVGLGKKGMSPAKIGLVLKEKHNVPKMRVLGKKISKILKENNVEYETDLDSLNKKINKLEVHNSKNKNDKRVKREIVRLVARKKKFEIYQEKRSKK